MMRKPYTVSEINEYIDRLFSSEPSFQNVMVEGEITNLKYNQSGHIYFTLKDNKSELSGIMWRSKRMTGLEFDMSNGDKVLVYGQIGVYAAYGKYQIYADKIEKSGIGELYIKFEAEKKKLAEMGIFDSRYKKPLPKYPRTVGVVTAETGAAVRDIIQISARRNPYVQLILSPARVQGEGAAESVAYSLARLSELHPDVIIIGRGGGSIEDLWAFNEEIVARAIFNCPVPVISAVGHETDTTIADLTADMRAPTPSAAAELAVPLASDIEERFLSDEQALLDNIDDAIIRCRDHAETLGLKLSAMSPDKMILRCRQRAAYDENRMSVLMERSISIMRKRILPDGNILSGCIDKAVANAKYRAGIDDSRLSREMESDISDGKHLMQKMTAVLEGLSPLKRLMSGYGYASDADGKHIVSVDDVSPGDKFNLRIYDGLIRAVTADTEKYKEDEYHGKRKEDSGRIISGA